MDEVQQGEAASYVHDVWARVIDGKQSRSSSVRMLNLRQVLCRRRRFRDARAHAYWREAARMHNLRQVLHRMQCKVTRARILKRSLTHCDKCFS